MRAEYLNSPAFAALNLSPAQVRAAESLPVIFSQFFGKRLELWLREVNKLVAAHRPSPVECGQVHDWESRGAQFERSDAGRKASGIKERRDCTVRAVAAALDIPYAEAHSKLAALGRKSGCGVTFREPTFAGPLGLELCPELSCRRLEKILPELRVGRFIVRIHRHVFAVIHGVIKDARESNPGATVRAVYRVKGII